MRIVRPAPGCFRSFSFNKQIWRAFLIFKKPGLHCHLMVTPSVFIPIHTVQTPETHRGMPGPRSGVTHGGVNHQGGFCRRRRRRPAPEMWFGKYEPGPGLPRGMLGTRAEGCESGGGRPVGAHFGLSRECFCLILVFKSIFYSCLSSTP